LLEDHGVPYRYREYTQQRLDADEIRALLGKLGLRARDVLRTRDKAYGQLGLSGDESDDVLVAHLAAHPTLLQRPIGVAGDRAVIGRPPERLLDLV
jgi:arsenate reductase